MSDVDALVDRAVSAVSTIARRGSTLTTGVALVAGVVLGATYLVGLAAFGGGMRTAWAIIGAVLLLVAVGAPLVASFRLRAIPQKANSLVGELRTLLGRDESARRVVIDTVESEPSTRGPQRKPAVIMEFQRFSKLSSFARSDDVRNLASVARTIGTLPVLVSAGILLTGVGAFLGFIFFLIWIF